MCVGDACFGACEKFHKEDLPCFRASVLVQIVYKTGLIFALAAAALAPAFSGCEKRIEAANIDTVNRMQAAAEKNLRGLTPKEVESVLGQPTKVEPVIFKREVNEVREIPGERYIYRQDGKDIVLNFVNGKLEDPKVPQFDAKAPANADEAKAPNSGLKFPLKKN
jgi:hypothetical protein